VSDLNGFKQVNDNQGHLAGNKILKRVGEAFRDCCREYDYVGRMGGDEFVFVLGSLPEDSLGTKIDQIDQAVWLAGNEINAELSISIGSAVYPDDGREAEALLAEADRRMYGVKRRRRESRNGDPLLSLTNLSRTLEAAAATVQS
jgi:diguanylate cyclase (GGDEF)-like protein